MQLEEKADNIKIECKFCSVCGFQSELINCNCSERENITYIVDNIAKSHQNFLTILLKSQMGKTGGDPPIDALPLMP